MSEPVIDPEALASLSEQLWRRLGITQTFDKLLVTEAALRPAPSETMRDNIAGQLSGGAVKFWELSFPKLKKDLERRQLLTESQGQLALSEAFGERLREVIEGVSAGSSKVEPTPGVTLDDVLKKVKAREAREKAARSPRSARGVGTRTRKPAGTAGATKPIKRAGKAPASDVAPPGPAAKPAPRPAAVATPLNKIFTTIKLNKLLDALDNSQSLLRNQLGTRLQLGQADLSRFLTVTDAVDLTRVSRDDMVSLHWKGQELSRTASADRRMALIELVKTLRAEGEKLEV